MQQQLAELPAFDADIDATQRMARLREVLAQLRPTHRAAVVLHYRDGLSRDEAVRLAVQALAHDGDTARDIPARDVEAAVLDRTRAQQRKFLRLTDPAVDAALAGGSA